MLDQNRRRWDSSAALREAYGSIYRAMGKHALSGPALEVGSGTGTIKEFLPNVVTSDIRPTPYIDRVASAYDLAQGESGRWATIYGLDVLHHLREPFRFFGSAMDALQGGGRIVLCEPAATCWGRLLYRCFHHEPMHPERITSPFEFSPDNARGDFANMGMAWAFFVRERAVVIDRLAGLGLALRHLEFRDVLAYPATGGFSGPRLLPVPVLRVLLALESRLPQPFLRVVGTRLLVVLEKRGA